MGKTIRGDVEGRRDRERERRYQRRFARRHGYFWLPCPLCGEEFGGHEKGGGFVATPDPQRRTGICPDCTAERQQLAEEKLVLLGESASMRMTRWGAETVGHKVPAVIGKLKPRT